MSDNLMEKVTALGERLKIGGAEVGRRVSAGVSSVSFKMKELFQGPNQADMIVEEATAELLEEPDWATNLEICDMVNHQRINIVELIRAVKKRIMMKSPRIQYFSLVLLETIVNNCDEAFSEVAAERLLDEMVKLIDDPQTLLNNRNKALILIESWGESSDELRYLPVYEETYKSLRSRGIRFPGRNNESLAPPIFTPPTIAEAEINAVLPEHANLVQTFSPEQMKEAFDLARNSIELLSTVLSSSPQEDVLKDELTMALIQQCHSAQSTVQRIIEAAGDDNAALLFEALNVNDNIQKVVSEYEDLKQQQQKKKACIIQQEAEPANDDDEMMDDLDEMIFGKKADKDDLISF